MTGARNEGLRTLERELLCRLGLMESDGVWVILDAESVTARAETVALATISRAGKDCVVVLSTSAVSATGDVDGVLARVPLRWLVDELPAETLLIVDPHDLPGVRISVGEIQRLLPE
jgi:hypothetical protein